MKLIGMLNEVVTSLFKKAVTVKYPESDVPVPERYRGRLDYAPDKCTGCMLLRSRLSHKHY